MDRDVWGSSAPASAAVLGELPGLPGGGSAGNLKLNNANATVLRLVAKRTGRLAFVHVKVRALLADGSSYTGGTVANWSWEVAMRPVRPDGTYDNAALLRAVETFNPNTRMIDDGQAIAAVSNGQAIRLLADFDVIEGQEFAVVVRAANGAPAVDYASLNLLYASPFGGLGHEGANGRNERNPGATDAYYGLDPRELVGGSSADGATQWYPGNNFNGAPFAKHLPVYVQQFADGARVGQPYYTASQLAAGAEVVMVHRVPAGERWLIDRIGANVQAVDAFTARLFVDDVERASGQLASVAGATNPRTAAFDRVVADAGDLVKVKATPNVLGALRSHYSDTVFRTLMGNQSAAGPRYYEADPTRIVPLYPLGVREAA